VTQFFHNGDCLRVDVIPPLLRLLEDLAAAIKASPKCRFYSSSLLLIYDGAGAVHCCSTHDSSSNSSSFVNSSSAAAAAAASGKSSNSDGSKHRKHSSSNISSSSSSSSSSSDTTTASSRAKQQFADPAAAGALTAAGSGDSPAQVDVRMIDFANSLCTSRAALAGAAGGAASYDSGLDALHPEDGCLLGLRNLIAVLSEIHRGASCAATSPPSR
jgi:Inositol polyphosphate kinase